MKEVFSKTDDRANWAEEKKPNSGGPHKIGFSAIKDIEQLLDRGKSGSSSDTRSGGKGFVVINRKSTCFQSIPQSAETLLAERSSKNRSDTFLSSYAQLSERARTMRKNAASIAHQQSTTVEKQSE